MKTIQTIVLLLSSLAGLYTYQNDKDGFNGIDVSHHNGIINWSKVSNEAPNIQFVYIKATDGATWQDPLYLNNATGARKVGFRIGVYHFFRMTSSAHDQFTNFSNMLDSSPFDLIPMVDVETRDNAEIGSFRDSLKVFLDLIEEHYHVVPMIYGTNRSYNELCGDAFDGKYPLYIGRYGDNVPIVRGHSRYTIWQYTEEGSISGIDKHVDLCRFNPESNIDDIIMSTTHLNRYLWNPKGMP